MLEFIYISKSCIGIQFQNVYINHLLQHYAKELACYFIPKVYR